MRSIHDVLVEQGSERLLDEEDMEEVAAYRDEKIASLAPEYKLDCIQLSEIASQYTYWSDRFRPMIPPNLDPSNSDSIGQCPE